MLLDLIACGRNVLTGPMHRVAGTDAHCKCDSGEQEKQHSFDHNSIGFNFGDDRSFRINRPLVKSSPDRQTTAMGYLPRGTV